jgi:hypothetical protein
MVMNNRNDEEEAVAKFKVISRQFAWDLRHHTKNLSDDRRYVNRDSKHEPFEQEMRGVAPGAMFFPFEEYTKSSVF